jgi:hypothetical protein
MPHVLETVCYAISLVTMFSIAFICVGYIAFVASGAVAAAIRRRRNRKR